MFFFSMVKPVNTFNISSLPHSLPHSPVLISRSSRIKIGVIYPPTNPFKRMNGSPSREKSGFHTSYTELYGVIRKFDDS